MEKRELVAHRPVEPGDHNFICATWVNGFANGHPKHGDYWYENYIEQTEKHLFLTNYSRVVNLILEKPGIQTVIACMREEPDIILGYIVTEANSDGSTIHWVHVKEAWRGIGIARDLAPKDTKYVTHLTRPGLSLKRRYGLIYDPFKI